MKKVLFALVICNPLVIGVINCVGPRTGTGHAATQESLENTYNAVFSKGNYVLQPITQEQSEKWKQLLDKVNTYIATYNPNLVQDASTIDSLSRSIITELQTTYASVADAFKNEWLKKNGAASFSAFKNQIDLEKLSKSKIFTLNLYLQTLAPQIKAEIVELQKAQIEPGDSRPASLLFKLAQLLDGVVSKAMEDNNAIINELAYASGQRGSIQ